MGDDYREHLEVAERAARAGGARLGEVYGTVTAREKAPGDLLTDADLASQRAIAEVLRDAFPGHTMLAEEEQVVPDAENPWRWIVDPLDGTINYAHGFPFWCVSIALEHRGRLVVGVIYDPLRDVTYRAATGLEATVDGRPMRVSAAGGLSESLIATGFPTNFAADAGRQLAYLGRFSAGTHSVRRTGSSALNLAMVAAGAFDVCYATLMHAWDAAAGVVLVREAGGTVTDLAGNPYNPYGGSILATNGRVHAEALRAVAEAWPPTGG